MDNPIVKIYEPEELLPLYPFFEELKRKRFSVTPLQIINSHRVILEYSSSVKNEKQLCPYLSPIFATTVEEQLLFKQVFEHHFKRDEQFEELPKQKPGSSLKKNAGKRFKTLIAIYLIVAASIIGLIIQTTNFSRIDPSQISITLSTKTSENKYESSDLFFQVNAKEKLELETRCLYMGHKSSDLKLHVNFNWGDGQINDLSFHTYDKPGIYRLNLDACVLYKSDTVQEKHLERSVKVCTGNTRLSFLFKTKKDSIKINDVIKAKVIIDGMQPARDSDIRWYVNDELLEYGSSLWTYFAYAGQGRISCQVIYDSLNSNCSFHKDTAITIYADRKNDTINKIATPAQIPAVNDKPFSVKAPRYLYNLYATLAIVFLLLAIFFMLMWNRETGKRAHIKRSVQQKLNELTADANNKRKISTLSFKNKNELPVNEKEFNIVARLMRARVNDSSIFLNIRKTINKSIYSGGLFQAVHDLRTRQSEYLVLIDEDKKQLQQVKFFEFLTGVLAKQNVLITKYYYSGNLLRFYSNNFEESISLEKLSEKYPLHILLIFGEAWQFIDKSLDEIKNPYHLLLNRWQYKAVITPVSFCDWGEQEKDILVPQLPIFPVDLPGLIMMAETISNVVPGNGNDIIVRLKQHTGIFYSSEELKFTNSRELLKYCNRFGWARTSNHGKPVNILFEWIAALAIYPVIHWEMIISIGRAILERYGMTEELNFTNLLRIIRIDGIRQGNFLPSLRLELLQAIKNENELAARETILSLLREIPKNETPKKKATAYREEEMQRIINEFSLYAYNPVVYSSYIDSGRLFAALWKADKIEDETTRTYFKNEQQRWGTLINVPVSDDTFRNAGIDEYFISLEKEETLLSSLYLWLGIISIIVFVSSLFAFRILYVWDNVL